MSRMRVRVGVIAVALAVTVMVVFAAMAQTIEVEKVVTADGYQTVTVTFSGEVDSYPAPQSRSWMLQALQ